MGLESTWSISADLQKELPGLKEFPSGNLEKIGIFAEAYSPHIIFSSTLSTQIKQTDSGKNFSISSTLSNQIEGK